jgi:hypothetical protein
MCGLIHTHTSIAFALESEPPQKEIISREEKSDWEDE